MARRTLKFGRRPWSDRDYEILRRMVGEGASAAAIAAVLGRSEAAVHVRISQCRLRPRRIEQRIDLVELERLYAAGLSLKEIARRLGTTAARINYAARENALVRAGRSWVRFNPSATDGDLLRLSADGVNPTEIGRRLGMPAAGVRSRLMTLARWEAWREAYGAGVSRSHSSPLVGGRGRDGETAGAAA